MKVAHPTGTLEGKVRLPGSKSMSNRLLIIRSLCKHPFEITGLSTADDTRILRNLLSQQNDLTYNAGLAGTTLRFLLARLCLMPGFQTLTGKGQLMHRPIAPLVDALRQLGANIEYTHHQNRLPVSVGETKAWKDRVVIRASQSSQFVSALLMIAPALPKGLHLILDGPMTSKPYVEMTLKLMSRCGINWNWNKNAITIPNQDYAPPPDIHVEPDWSAAAFFYEMAALAKQAELEFPGLQAVNSVQGDAIAADLFQPLGISSKLTDSGIVIKKIEGGRMRSFKQDFSNFPDLAQPIVVTCAGLGIASHFKGLQSLRLKETDRIRALQKELAKISVSFHEERSHGGTEGVGVHGVTRADTPYRLDGDTPAIEGVVFETWEDHRMAMALAPLSLLAPIGIENPEVVSKSFPEYWNVCLSLGFRLQQW